MVEVEVVVEVVAADGPTAIGVPDRAVTPMPPHTVSPLTDWPSAATQLVPFQNSKTVDDVTEPLVVQTRADPSLIPDTETS